MHTVQVTNTSIDELLDRLASMMPGKKDPTPSQGMINVLNKRSAARILDISESLFTKLHNRGLIPTTVNAGIGKHGDPVKRWAEHHLLMIKSEIHKLRNQQNEYYFLEAKKTINKILGL